MIVYALRCAGCGHEFEEWFENMADFDARKQDGRLKCGACGGHDVAKAIMAPNVGKTAATPAMPPCAVGGCGGGGGGMCPMMG